MDDGYGMDADGVLAACVKGGGKVGPVGYGRGDGGEEKPAYQVGLATMSALMLAS